MLPSVGFVGSNVDNAQWENILRSVSAYRSYNWLNEYEFNPSGICKYLISCEVLLLKGIEHLSLPPWNSIKFAACFLGSIFNWRTIAPWSLTSHSS